jgi:[acyl-carrier-protein] S-malonyltransferase
MQEAVPPGEGAMAAILGLEAGEVLRACEEAAEGEVVAPANLNGPGQVVIAGAREAVRRAGERAKARGARRVIPLQVSAPFHCALMRPAEQRLTPELRALETRDPRVPVIANVDAEPVRTGHSAVEALARQVSAPVLWDAVVRRLMSYGARAYIEVGPGGVLTGLVRKIHRDAATAIFDEPAGLDAVAAFFESRFVAS